MLRRIASGVNPVTSRESGLAKTVYALRDRRLVTTPRSGGVWTAVVTDAGRFYLENGRYQGSAARSGRPVGSDAIADPGHGQDPAAGEHGEPGQVVRVASPRELIDRLTGGKPRLRVESPAAEVRAAWRRVIDAAGRQGLVPAGRRLRYSGRDRGDLVVELVPARPADCGDGGDGPRLKGRVVVPEVVDTSVPVVAVLQDRPEGLDVSQASRLRALLLVQALTGAATRRGHTVEADDGGGSGFWIGVEGRRYRLVMGEEQDSVEYVPGLDDADGGPRVYDWQRVRPQTRQAWSGRLFLELVDDSFRHQGRRRRWADRKRWRLDDKLVEVLAEVEDQARLDAQAQQAAEQARIARAAAWEQAMQTARSRYVEHQRVLALEDQLDRWERAGTVRTFRAAVTAVAGDPPPDPGLREWIAWMGEYADRIDPLLPEPVAPAEPPQPGPEELRPYLKGFSPYGPDRRA